MSEKTQMRALRIAAAVLLCMVAGLSAFLSVRLREHRTEEGSRHLLADAELYRAAGDLARELENGGVTLAYHDAREAAEAARFNGREEAAAFFDGIARELLDGAEPAGKAEAVRHFLETGIAAEDDASAGETAELTMTEEEPRILSRLRLEKAQSCANRLIGANAVLHLCEKNRDGLLIFTCANAYAVIDEKSGLPVEASLSLAPAADRPKLSAEECAARARAFLASFFPEDLAEAAVMSRIAPAENGQVLRAEFFGAGRYYAVDVRRDTGRITGLRT